MSRPALCVFLLALLAGCAGLSPSGESRADAATQSACRQRADEQFDRQNRATIYSPPPSVNSPFSSSYTPGVTDRGLGAQFAHDNLIRDCVRNTGTGADRPASAPSPARP